MWVLDVGEWNSWEVGEGVYHTMPEATNLMISTAMYHISKINLRHSTEDPAARHVSNPWNKILVMW